MDITHVWENLAKQTNRKIIYLILDGLGGLPNPNYGGTELQVAKTPNLDKIAQQSSCGLLELVGAGITPGSGPGHLSLFGYHPINNLVGRGILAALGIDFELQENDIAARVNFATINEEGKVTDRRAGRIETELNQKLCSKIRDKVKLDFEGEYFLETVSEHRAVLILRGKGLGGNLEDTDPQSTGVKPRPPKATAEDSQKTAEIVSSFVQQVKEVIADEDPANMVLLRGFDAYSPYPSLKERFKLRGLCIADYPMYRGVSHLLGLNVLPKPGGMKQRFYALKENYNDDSDFYFLHIKKSDSTGEDGNFEGKVKVLEAVDELLPMITNLNPDVLVVAADHSTPATMARHSWHPIPVMIQSEFARVDAVDRFDEYSCLQGSLGLRPGIELIGLALANAGKLRKFGA
ncbi:MAG: 2,3-bisphosphoglycerate-independent phosphoglycerate mutase [Halothece sp.]